MVKRIRVDAEIPPNRELRVMLPSDFPTGPAEIEVVVSSPGEPSVRTCGDFLSSEFFGMWRNRTDIGDSTKFARALREEAWKRPIE